MFYFSRFDCKNCVKVKTLMEKRGIFYGLLLELKFENRQLLTKKTNRKVWYCQYATKTSENPSKS